MATSLPSLPKPNLSLARCINCQARYQNCTGLKLKQCIWRDWVRNKGLKLLFFSSNQRSMERHPKNLKGVDAVSHDMAERLGREGLMEEFRSKIIVMAREPNDTAPECQFYWVVSGGTLTDAVYIAASRNPENEMVALTLDIGLEDVIEITNPCPDDVVEYLTDKGNDFHDGAPNTWVQALEKTLDVEAAWEVFKDENGIRRTTCPKKGKLSYEARYSDFVKATYHETWKGKWDHYNDCKVAHHYLDVTLKFMSGFKQDLGRLCLYNNREMPEHKDMWKAIHQLTTVLQKQFDDTISRDIQKVIIVEFMFAFVPCRQTDDKGDKHDRKRCITTGTDFAKFCKWVTCPMKGSVTYTIKQKPTPAASKVATVAQEVHEEPPQGSPADEADEPAEQPEPANKRRRKKRVDAQARGGRQSSGELNDKNDKDDEDDKKRVAQTMTHRGRSSATSAGSSGPTAAGTASTTTMILPKATLQTTIPGRDKLWLDCLASNVQISAIGFKIKEHYRNEQSHQCVRRGLHFLMEKCYTITKGRKPTVKWSLAKYAQIHMTIEERKAVRDAPSPKNLDGDDVSLSQQVDDEPAPSDAVSAQWHETITTFLSVAVDVQRLHDFLKVNDPTVPRALCPLYNDAQTSLTRLVVQAAKAGGATTRGTFLATIYDYMEDIISPLWIRVGDATMGVAKASDTKETLSSDAETIFTNYDTCSQFVLMRPRVVLEMMTTFTDSAMGPFALKDLTRATVDALLAKDVFARVAGIDRVLYNKTMFVDAWDTICQRAAAITKLDVHKDDGKGAVPKALLDDLNALKATIDEQNILQNNACVDANDDKEDKEDVLQGLCDANDDDEDDAVAQPQWTTMHHELQMTWAAPFIDKDVAKIEERDALFGPAQYEHDVAPATLVDFIAAANDALVKVLSKIAVGDQGYTIIQYRDNDFKHGAWLRKGSATSYRPLAGAVALNLSGTLSQQPTMQCMPCCYVFNRRFYVSPTMANNVNAEVPFPAWSVQTKESDTTMKMDSMTVTVSFTSGLPKMAMTGGRLSSSLEKYVVQLKVHTLKLHDETVEDVFGEDGKILKTMELTRPITPFEKAIKEQIAEAKKKAADARKALLGAEAQWNADCKHLRS